MRRTKAEKVTWRDLKRKADSDGNYEIDIDKWYNNKPPLTPQEQAQKKQNKLIKKGAIVCIAWITIVVVLSVIF